MKNKILLYIAAAAASVMASCSDYLDVKPSDRISEENNFSTLPGFKQALNGIYVELNSNQLYGRTLSCEFIEIMAQRYNVSQQNQSATEVMKLNHTNSVTLSRLNGIWGTAYNLIANINLIIRNCESHRQVLPDEYYHLIKGEAYALRAYLHFDLFRLFGGIYDPDKPTTGIPYYTDFQLDVAPTLSSIEFMDKVIADLDVAEEELQDDPVITYGVNGNTKDVFLAFRNLRLNYFAVQALKARCYYYMHDDTNTYTYAKKVVEAQERYFPWMNPITLTRTNIDRVFSSEIIFALQNLQRETLYTALFDGNNLKQSTLLAPKESVVSRIFDDWGSGYGESDYRVMACLKKSVEQNSETYRIFNKYQGTDSLYNQMIPMLRVSEAFLILSEVGPDDAERMETFNKYRNARGLPDNNYISELNEGGDVDYLIGAEWLKEFFGEGQLFFWYKRHGARSMRSATDTYNDSPFQVSLSQYVLPIPDAETKFN